MRTSKRRGLQFWAACVQILRGETCIAEISSPPGMWTNTTDTKTSFCIEHTIQKPLKLSVPISESFIRSPHPFYRYNFHLLNGPLLVSLPSAQRHTQPLSDKNPVQYLWEKLGEKTRVKSVISPLNLGNYTWCLELMSWLSGQGVWRVNAYVTRFQFRLEKEND